MKKILSYILISFVIFTNLFAPFTVGIGEKNNIRIEKNEAHALNFGDIVLSIETLPNDKEIGINVSVNWAENTTGTANGVQLILTAPDGSKQIKYADFPITDSFSEKQSTTTPVLFSDLTPGTTYSLRATARLSSLGLGVSTGAGGDNLYLFPTDDASLKDIKDKINETVIDETITTKTTYVQNVIVDKKVTNDNTKRSEQQTMPACSTGYFSFSVGGCFAQIVYYVLFVPTSYLFALAGTFFDYTFAYSINDTSYRSAFVVQGWGLVRDFCNMFFIFIMLYIAIGTILSLHSMKTKETIINVVIIGLFINFSLFATQIIIDASNITARVFYNSDAIKITENGANGVANATPGLAVGEGGVIPLSAALVNKINPQNIIINAGKVNDIAPVSNTSVLQNEESEANMTAGTFILIVLLAVGVNVVGIIVFLSVGLIFVSRVIGLWLAMIMAPLAFFTYILPEMSSTKMIGWKNWWQDTLKLAFLAPVFIFFMYIILKFLQLDLIADPINKTGTGLEFFVATIIPFAFVMILMMKAKSIASDMSGEIGKQITGGISAIGGMALGGAALGAAAVGRGLIANPMKMMKSDATRNAALKNFNMLKPSTYGKAVSAGMAHIGLKTQAGVAVQKKLTGYGKEIGEKSHAEHILNEQADKISKGSKFSDLDSGQQARAKTAASKIEIARTLYKKDADKLTSDEARDVESYIDAAGEVKGVNMDRLRQSMVNVTTNVTQLLNQAAQAAHGMNFNQLQTTNLAASNDILDQVTKLDKFHDAKHLEDKYNTRIKDFMGVGKTISSIPTSSFDVRNAKMSGLLAPIGGAMKLSLSSLGMSAGKAQGDFMKDLKQTLTESVEKISKSMKVEVKVDGGHGGGGGGHDDHGAKDAHGGGGHH